MKAILKYGFLLVLIGWLVFAVTWANVKANEEVCTNVNVEILNADSVNFLTKEGIIKELSDAHINPIGKPITSINTQAIENTLRQFDYLEGAECVIQNNSIVTIQVTQMIPVVRIFTPHGSFYVNKSGKKIKAKERYHIDVPIVIGNFDNRRNKVTDVIPLAIYIKENPALSQYVTAIKYNDANDIYLIPNIEGHVVNFGDGNNIESKFANLEKFYSEVMPVKGWWTYDTISVKWDNQIVASKRNFTKHTTEYIEDVDLDADESAIDLSPITPESEQNKTQNSSTKHENSSEEKEVPKEKIADSKVSQSEAKSATKKASSTKATSEKKTESSKIQDTKSQKKKKSSNDSNKENKKKK